MDWWNHCITADTATVIRHSDPPQWSTCSLVNKSPRYWNASTTGRDCVPSAEGKPAQEPRPRTWLIEHRLCFFFKLKMAELSVSPAPDDEEETAASWATFTFTVLCSDSVSTKPQDIFNHCIYHHIFLWKHGIVDEEFTSHFLSRDSTLLNVQESLFVYVLWQKTLQKSPPNLHRLTHLHFLLHEINVNPGLFFNFTIWNIFNKCKH